VGNRSGKKRKCKGSSAIERAGAITAAGKSRSTENRSRFRASWNTDVLTVAKLWTSTAACFISDVDEMRVALAVSALAVLTAAAYFLRVPSRSTASRQLHIQAPKPDTRAATTEEALLKDGGSQDQDLTRKEYLAPVADASPKPISDILSGEIIAVERLRNHGSSTAAAAIESWLWASLHSAEPTASNLTRASPRYLDRPREELISNAMRAASTIKVFRVQRHELYGSDRMLVWIEPDSSGRSDVFLMTRTGKDGTWQRDLDPRAFK
jgi:hypothetical protein